MQESRICDYCQKSVAWRWSGKRLKDGSRIYLDDKGRRWAGKRCAACEKARVQTAIRFNRFDRIAITKKLEEAGYKIKKFSNPVIVEEEEGKIKHISLRKAYIDETGINLEQPLDEQVESYLLVFTSSRIFTKEQLSDLSVSE